MVYTDGIHLTADSLDELYEYANKIGLNSEWIDFRGRNFHPHFDICGNVKQRVLEDIEVQKVNSREIVRLCKANFRVSESDSTDGDKNKANIELPSDADYERMINNIFAKSGLKRSKKGDN